MKHYIIATFLLLGSCSDKPPINQEQVFVTEEKISPSYSNPALFTGGTILHFFQASSNAQQYDLMLTFTADSIVKQWGRDSVLNYYRATDLGFKILKLKSMIKNGNEYTLLYMTNSIATKRQLIVKCRVINDTAKIILPITNKD